MGPIFHYNPKFCADYRGERDAVTTNRLCTIPQLQKYIWCTVGVAGLATDKKLYRFVFMEIIRPAQEDSTKFYVTFKVYFQGG